MISIPKITLASEEKSPDFPQGKSSNDLRFVLYAIHSDEGFHVGKFLDRKVDTVSHITHVWNDIQLEKAIEKIKTGAKEWVVCKWSSGDISVCYGTEPVMPELEPKKGGDE